MSTENLNHTEAVEKLQHLVDTIDIGMLSTFHNHTVYPHSVPMSRQKFDNQGNIWFLFSSESETFNHLMKNNKVSLTFADAKTYQFVSVNGIAEISEDAGRIEKYWNKFIETWFGKGKEDPAIRLLKVIPNEVYYWDSKANKLINLIKIAVNAISGNETDTGREGNLNL